MVTKRKTTKAKPAVRETPAKKSAAKKAPAKPTTPVGSNRSGYMDDVMPERAGIDHPGTVAPKASENGRREGRTSPGERHYAARYEMVDANTAMERALARQRGELPLIEGGLDMDIDDSDFDPLGDVEPGPMDYNPEPGSDALVAEEKLLAQRHGVATRAVPAPLPPQANNSYDPLGARTRVSLELADGTMTMPAIDVLPGAYGVTILLPLQADGVTFIPKPGSSVVIMHGENRWPCYFPGTHFEWEAMHCLGLVFVRADEE